MKHGRILSLICSLVTAPCVVYYLSKFYLNGELHFGNESLLAFSIVAGLIIVGLTRLMHVESKLDKAIALIQQLQDSVDTNHYEQLKYNDNTRRILMKQSKEDK
ncbi:MAG: hypothetical protein ACRCX8_03485 [Sarcina sp.]